MERGRKSLLDLPPEVLEMIAFQMDVATFYTSLFICAALAQVFQTQRNLLHHISTLTGSCCGIRHLDAARLGQIFRSKATKSFCAAQTLTDQMRYVLSDGHPLISKSIISYTTPPLLATVDHIGTVNIYSIVDTVVCPVARLSLLEMAPFNPCRMTAVKMAFSTSGDLAILLKPQQLPEKSHDFSPLETRLHTWDLSLVTFLANETPDGGFAYASCRRETRVISCFVSAIPLGLALAPLGVACIAWKDQYDNSSVWYIGRNAELMAKTDYDEFPDRIRMVINQTGTENTAVTGSRLIARLEFAENGRTLHCYQPGNPVHSWFVNLDRQLPQAFSIRPNEALTYTRPDHVSREFTIGITFDGNHQHSECVSAGRNHFCYMSSFAVAVEQPYWNHPEAIVVYLAGSVSPWCPHQEEVGRERQDRTWMPVVHLAGWHHGVSSLGTIMVISPNGCSIATANWKVVSIWALGSMFDSARPSDVLERVVQEYFYPRNSKTPVQLRQLYPTELHANGVIHSLRWTDETTLFAVTDQGIVSWNLAANCRGRREWTVIEPLAEFS